MFSVVFAVLLLLLVVGGFLWVVGNAVTPLLRNISIWIRCARRGEKTPWVRQREEIDALRANIISEEEAKERARAFAREQGFEGPESEPWNVQLSFRETANRKEGEPPGSFSYVMHLGSYRSSPFLKMDAIDGTIQTFKVFPC